MSLNRISRSFWFPNRNHTRKISLELVQNELILELGYVPVHEAFSLGY